MNTVSRICKPTPKGIIFVLLGHWKERKKEWDAKNVLGNNGWKPLKPVENLNLHT